MEDSSLMLVITMAFIVFLSTSLGSLAVNSWSVLKKVFWISIGALPLLSCATNIWRVPIYVEIELISFLAGVVTGTTIILNSKF